MMQNKLTISLQCFVKRNAHVRLLPTSRKLKRHYVISSLFQTFKSIYIGLFVSWTVRNKRTDTERYNMYSTNSVQYTHV